MWLRSISDELLAMVEDEVVVCSSSRPMMVWWWRQRKSTFFYFYFLFIYLFIFIFIFIFISFGYLPFFCFLGICLSCCKWCFFSFLFFFGLNLGNCFMFVFYAFHFNLTQGGCRVGKVFVAVLVEWLLRKSGWREKKVGFGREKDKWLKWKILK